MNNDECLKIVETAIIRAFKIPKELIYAQETLTALDTETRKLIDDTFRRKIIEAEEEALQNYRSAVLDKDGKFVRKID